MGLDEALRAIAGHFVPNLKELRERSGRLKKDFPLAAMIPIAKMSEGQVVANIGSFDTDPDGALLHAVSDEIGYGMYFLASAFDRA